MDDDDHLRFLFASAFREGGAAEGCPEPDRLVDALELRLTPTVLGEVVDHVSACPVCAEAWRLLVLERSQPVDPP